MISLTTADNALKNVYLEVINNQLNNDLDPFYSKITKTSNDVVGNTIKRMITVGMNGGIGAGSEDGSLPTAKENNYIQLTATLKNLYAQLEITDKAVRTSQNDTGAFLNLLNTEMDNLIESSKYNLRSMLYGDGNNFVGSSTSWTKGSSVYFVGDARPFVVGMRVDGYMDFEIQQYLTNVEVLDVDYDNNKIILQSSAAAQIDYSEDVDISFMSNNNPNPITGLTSIMTNDLKIYGLVRAEYPFMIPNASNIIKSSLNFIKILQILDDLKINFDSNIDLIVSGYEFRRIIQSLLKDNAINCDLVNLEGGMRAISLNGVPIAATKFVMPPRAFVLDSSVFTMHQLCDWTWMTNDKGQVLRQKQGYAAHTATLVKYCELVCSRICNNSYITLV